ncbi:MAG: CoA-binding protein [Nanoarchaeota archaeon]|nr:CoA-binding protein [Nanoarchaeota archaeon]MBU4352668.1 CoA-binding protein [Nanoarchaeota archaeon]MBU4456927.1 CoA-binding protein [Nanoarchaeota archaeon]
MKELFEPRSVAVIGASRNKLNVGHGVLYNLIYGGFFNTKHNKPFKGKIYPVNPKAKKILDLECYASVKDVKAEVDLGVIAVKAELVPLVVRECVEKKVKALIVISAGFGELGEEGKKLQAEIAALVKSANIPLVGPNCLGIINPHFNLNASFAPAMPPTGSIGFISQSGALADSVIDWALEKNYGFSKLISYGNAADLDLNDFIAYLDKDKDTKAIAVYVESIRHGKEFMKIARSVKKPIVVIKAGKTEQGVKAVSSHTGSLAGSYEVYKAAFKQSNVHLVENIEELFEAAEVLALLPKLKDNKIAIITNGGGAGVLTADYCFENGLILPKLSNETLSRLESKMHPAWSRSNPIDLVGDALSDRYNEAIFRVLKQKDVYGLIVIQTLQTMTDPVENAKAIISAKKHFSDKPVIAVYMGGMFTKEGKEYLKEHNIPVFNDPEKAVKAMKALVF